MPVPAESVSGTIRRLKRDGWPSRPREGRGGGREYPIASWPEPLREALLDAIKRRVPQICEVLEIADEPTASLPIPAEALPLPSVISATDPTQIADWQRRTRDARAALLQEVDRLQALAGHRAPGRAIDLIVEGARTGDLAPTLRSLVPVANGKAGKNGSRTLSRRTLYRWYGDRAESGIAGLVPRDPNRPAPVPTWLAPLLKLSQTPTKRSLQAVLEDLPKHLPPGVTAPNASTARRWLDKVAPQVRQKGRLGPRALLALKAFRRRDTSCLEPLDVAVADGHTFRAKVSHPITGKPMQPEVMAVIDAATRYAFGWSAGVAESTDVVMDALRHGVSTLGLIAVFYTDNGSGFVNEIVSDELTGYYARLGMLHERATPGRAQARGLVERPQSSLWRRSAKKLPTYTGRDMDREAAKRIEKLVEKDIKEAGASRYLMSWQDFHTFLAVEIDAYNNRPHRSLPKLRDPQTGALRHMTPAECLQSWRDKGWQPVTVSQAEADDLFRPYERRRTNRAEVQLPWGRYFHKELEPFHGDDVLVGYDIHDGSKVWVRTLEGRLICVAQRDGNLTPYMPASKVEHARQKRADGQIKRKQRQIEDIRVEAAGSGSVLDLTAETVLTPDEIAAAETFYAAIEPPPPTAPAPPSDERPRFADDQSWARWLVAHPDAATADDRKHLADQLRRNPFRMLMEAEGVDIAALAAIAATPKRITTDA